MIDHDAYNKEMLKAIERCQFIEETLKLCILSAIDITRLMTSKYFNLRYEMGDVVKLPMGPLIKKFSRVCQDDQLIKDLDKLRKERNFVAHQSMLFTLGELSDTESAENAFNKLKNIGEDATNIHERLLNIRYELVRKKQAAIRDTTENEARSKLICNK